jgi:hypothetical protein
LLHLPQLSEQCCRSLGLSHSPPSVQFTQLPPDPLNPLESSPKVSGSSVSKSPTGPIPLKNRTRSRPAFPLKALRIGSMGGCVVSAFRRQAQRFYPGDFDTDSMPRIRSPGISPRCHPPRARLPKSIAKARRRALAMERPCRRLWKGGKRAGLGQGEMKGRRMPSGHMPFT